MVYRGHVRNGKIELDEETPLPEGAVVNIAVVSEGKAADKKPGRSLRDRLEPFIGSAKRLPEDASINVDHYLYGHPKR
jgi:hypothetical protein